MGGKPSTTVLLVDPDPGPLIPLLRTVGSLITRGSATAALAAIEKHQPLVAIVEYRLADGSGLDVVAHIHLKYIRMPVVMATGAGSETICAAAFRLGVADYLIKPVEPKRLLGTVHRLLRMAASTNDEKAVTGDAHIAKQVLMDPQYASIRQAAQIIEAQFDEPVSLERLARTVGMGRFALSRHFSRVMGKSIRTYLGEYRVAKAKELLLTTRHPVTEIAQLVGFSDLPRFDKVFARQTGMTPSAYRKGRA